MPYPDLDYRLAIWIMATLQANAPLKALLGGTEADPRIYWFYQAEAEATADMPAYLSFAQVGNGRERGGMTDPTYSVRIYSYDLDLVYRIEAQLNTMFDRKVHTFDGDPKGVTTSRVQSSDHFDQQSKFAGREWHVSCGVLTTGR